MLYRMTEEEFEKLRRELRNQSIPFGFISPFGAVIGDKTKIVLEEDCDMPEPYNYQAFIEGYWIYIDYDFEWKDWSLERITSGFDGYPEHKIVTLKNILLVPASKSEKEQAEYKDCFFIINLIENLVEVEML